jgi:hypothetical protein
MRATPEQGSTARRREKLPTEELLVSTVSSRGSPSTNVVEREKSAFAEDGLELDGLQSGEHSVSFTTSLSYVPGRKKGGGRF